MSHGSRAYSQLPAQAAWVYEQGHDWLARMPVKVRLMLGLFLFAAVLMALHTALSSKETSLRLKLQYGFRSADLSMWIDALPTPANSVVLSGEGSA
jgi:hypothetical protein